MTVPSLPFELYALIVFFACLNTNILCALCLVDSDLQDLAIRQLYSKIVFRSIPTLELFFGGQSSTETAFDEHAEKEMKRAAAFQTMMKRRRRELGYVREIEMSLPDTLQAGAIQIPTVLLQSTPIPIDILRIGFFQDQNAAQFSPLFRILSPL